MWTPIATINLSTDWSYTAPVIGTWFRVRHIITSGREFRRGYIAQASGVELHGIRRMYSKQEFDVYQLIKPEPWEARSIAVREYFPARTGQDWIVTIEVWQNLDENLANTDFSGDGWIEGLSTNGNENLDGGGF